MRKFVRPVKALTVGLALMLAACPVYASIRSETNVVAEGVKDEDSDTEDVKDEDTSESESDTSNVVETKAETETAKTESGTETEAEQETTTAETEATKVNTTETEAPKESETVKETEKETETVKDKENVSTDATDSGVIDETETVEEEEKVKTTVTEIEPATVVLPEPTREGYTFIEWNTQIDGEGESYKAGDEIEVKPMALYAIWEANESAEEIG